MPAYSFQPQFVEPIRAGTKGGTIRAERRVPAKWSTYARDRHPGGHAAPGDSLYLFCRQRAKGGFPIGERACVGVEPVWLDFCARPRIDLRYSGITMRTPDDLDAFARFDGFAAFGEMAHFWESKHRTDAFIGWHIRWLPLPPFEALRG